MTEAEALRRAKEAVTPMSGNGASRYQMERRVADAILAASQEGTLPPPPKKLAEEVRKALAEALANDKIPVRSMEGEHQGLSVADVLGAPLPLPSGGLVPIPRRPFLDLLSRLLWLLGLSPAERAFVRDAADRVEAGDLAGAFDGLAVFADFLEENLSLPDGSPVRLLCPQSGDVLVFWCPRSGLRTADNLLARLHAVGRTVIGEWLPDGYGLDYISPAEMEKAGWVRAEAVEKAVEGELERCLRAIRVTIQGIHDPLSKHVLGEAVARIRQGLPG